MDIQFISPYVDGSMPLEKLKLSCVKRDKYSEVLICIRDAVNIPIATIRLFDTDLLKDAKASYEQACVLGDEIVNAFNNRLENAASKNSG